MDELDYFDVNDVLVIVSDIVAVLDLSPDHIWVCGDAAMAIHGLRTTIPDITLEVRSAAMLKLAIHLGKPLKLSPDGLPMLEYRPRIDVQCNPYITRSNLQMMRRVFVYSYRLLLMEKLHSKAIGAAEDVVQLKALIKRQTEIKLGNR